MKKKFVTEDVDRLQSGDLCCRLPGTSFCTCPQFQNGVELEQFIGDCANHDLFMERGTIFLVGR